MRNSAARRQNTKGIFVLLEAGKSTTDFIRLMKRVIGCMHERCSLPGKQQQTRYQYDYPCVIHLSICNQRFKKPRRGRTSYPRAGRKAISASTALATRHSSLSTALPQPPPPAVSMVSTSPVASARLSLALITCRFSRFRPLMPDSAPCKPQGA